jgi:hypothetical protein
MVQRRQKNDFGGRFLIRERFICALWKAIFKQPFMKNFLFNRPTRHLMIDKNWVALELLAVQLLQRE